MTKLTWETASDWDNAQSEAGVVHENFGDHSADRIDMGYPSFDRGGSALERYFPHDEDSGTTINDVAGDTTASGSSGITYDVAGIHGTALEMNQNPYDFDNLGFGISEGTISMWVRPTSNDLSNGIGMLQLRGNNHWQMRGKSSDWETFIFTGSTSQLIGGGDPTAGEWDHVAAVWDGSTLYLYVNASQVNSISVSSMDNAGDQSKIGTTPNLSDMEGRLDEIQVYSRALSQSELQAQVDSATQGTLTTGKKTS